MNVDDVYLVLYHHWVLDITTFPDGRQRLQIHFLILISGGTATRPGALVYVAKNEKTTTGYCIGEDDEDERDCEEYTEDSDCEWNDETAKALCYKDVTLFLLPNPNGIRDILGMEVNICRTKGHRKRPRRSVLHLYPCFEILLTRWSHIARSSFSLKWRTSYLIPSCS